ncbi:PREDICTED: uncharacterized protein LOC106107180 [Papilio polytes]|uniref:uncharacterized protein LOC106107180 n=1 Tax=Papilio polytes TaxID=76194 RepID=UPI00067607C8|nr:PREDICTED: uncharacterized protein LOC106107180 [Papilio polytes]
MFFYVDAFYTKMVNTRLFFFLFLVNVKCDKVTKLTLNDTKSSINQYSGDKFPTKYLTIENNLPNIDDFKLYILSLRRTVFYFNKTPNKTDGNVALGAFFVKSLLKRTLQEYGSKITELESNKLRNIISKCENLVSHYIYINYKYGWDDLEFRVSRMFKDDSAQIYSIRGFNKGRLKRWLHSSFKMHEYVEDMDTTTMPREKYTQLTESSIGYHIVMQTSDVCLSRVIHELEPIDFSEMKSCRSDKYCYKGIHSTPSISYSLTHRLLNIMLRRQVRRCYMTSVAEDDTLMDQLCAFMYREAVYIARRGFFARDLFLEHLTLCGMLGYEEFHRRNWFKKIISWMDQKGCIKESRNFNYNSTAIFIKRIGEDHKLVKHVRKKFYRDLLEDCDTHPMALLIVVLAHGIRYAAHNLP